MKLCKECASVASTLHKPVVKASLAEHFNQRVQTDLLFLWEKTFLLLVDECTRYCSVGEMRDKTPDEWLHVFFKIWGKLFGPPNTLATDQEGAVTSDLLGIAC